MRVVIQRVSSANVKVDGTIIGSIGTGLLIFVGIETADTVYDIHWLAGKIASLRVFNDSNGKMNLALKAVDGRILLISQFTLHGSTSKGNRPSYIRAARPEIAIPLYNLFRDALENATETKVETGVFGAHMEVSLVNDGPVTILMDSKNKE